MGMGRGKDTSTDEWSGASIDNEARVDVLNSLSVERVEATRVQRENLVSEDETLLAVDTIFFKPGTGR